MNARCKRQIEFKNVFESIHKYPISKFLPVTVNGITYTPKIKEKHKEYIVVKYEGTDRYYDVWLGKDEIQLKDKPKSFRKALI